MFKSLTALVAHALTATVAMAQPGSAALDNSSYLTTTATDSINPQQFTIEAEFRADGPGYGLTGDAYGETIVAKPRQNATGHFISSWFMAWVPSSGRVYMQVTHQFNSVGTELFSNATIPLGQTARVAATFDGAFLRLYINGALDGSVAASRAVVYYGPGEPVLIGAGNFLFGFTRRFQGKIDDVRIWGVARTAAEIADTCLLAPGPRPSLIGHWTFDDGHGLDTSGNARHAVFVDGPAAFGSELAPGADITQQPVSVLVCPSSQGGFSVTVPGGEVSAYRWQIQDAAAPGGFVDLTDGPLLIGGAAWGTVAGSRTRNCLFLHGVGNSGSRLTARCVVSSACGTQMSDPATLTICPADFNCSGSISVQDIFDFLAAYFGSDPRADFNASGAISVQDIFDFLAAYFAGC